MHSFFRIIAFLLNHVFFLSATAELRRGYTGGAEYLPLRFPVEKLKIVLAQNIRDMFKVTHPAPATADAVFPHFGPSYCRNLNPHQLQVETVD